MALMSPIQIDFPIDRRPDPFPQEKTRPRVFLVGHETDLRQIIVWLVQNRGYHALTPVNHRIARQLLAAERPLMIVSEHGTPFWATSAILAFCHPDYPEVPVVVASRDVLSGLPEVERLIDLGCGEACSAPRFEAEFVRRIRRRVG